MDIATKMSKYILHHVDISTHSFIKRHLSKFWYQLVYWRHGMHAIRTVYTEITAPQSRNLIIYCSNERPA